jgi:hypothetical protein
MTRVIDTIELEKEPTINSEQINILRRKICDMMCKDRDFCLKIISAALRTGGIKHWDAISNEEHNKLLAEHY